MAVPRVHTRVHTPNAAACSHPSYLHHTPAAHAISRATSPGVCTSDCDGEMRGSSCLEARSWPFSCPWSFSVRSLRCKFNLHTIADAMIRRKRNRRRYWNRILWLQSCRRPNEWPTTQISRRERLGNSKHLCTRSANAPGHPTPTSSTASDSRPLSCARSGVGSRGWNSAGIGSTCLST